MVIAEISPDLQLQYVLLLSYLWNRSGDYRSCSFIVQAVHRGLLVGVDFEGGRNALEDLRPHTFSRSSYCLKRNGVASLWSQHCSPLFSVKYHSSLDPATSTNFPEGNSDFNCWISCRSVSEDGCCIPAVKLVEFLTSFVVLLPGPGGVEARIWEVLQLANDSITLGHRQIGLPIELRSGPATSTAL
jgi:hypothetical protein